MPPPPRPPPSTSDRLVAKGWRRIGVNDQSAEEFENPVDGSRMVLVPAEGGEPALLVGKYEVSAADFARFLETDAARDTLGPNPEGPVQLKLQKSRGPVVWLTPWLAGAYAKWAGGRLPTLAEWVRVASHPEGRYPWGDAPTRKLHGYAKFGYESSNAMAYRTQLMPVEDYANGANRHGIHNLAGNAAELVWLPGGVFGCKGGSWRSRPEHLQVAADPQPYEPNPMFLRGVGMRLFVDPPGP